MGKAGKSMHKVLQDLVRHPYAGAERERERRTGHTVQLAAVTARHTNNHSAKRALIDPGDSSPSRMQAYGCRACAGVFGSMR